MAARKCRVAAALLLSGSVTGFLLPGLPVPRSQGAVRDVAAPRTVMMSKGNAPFATPEEIMAEEGLKVSPNAWKWPAAWPYTPDYFSRKNEKSVDIEGTPNLDPVYDDKASESLSKHYDKFIPKKSAVLEIGASSHSYMPEDLQLTRLVGVGVNMEEMNANSQLTDRLVQDLNENWKLPYADGEFDAVVMSNTIEYLVKPREVIRELWRVMKPGGVFIVSFATQNKQFQDRQIKLWQTMNDDQRIWIVGSFMWFACSEGFEDLKGFDHSAEGSKGMLAGLSGKTPCHIIQAYKAEYPNANVEPYRQMRALLWNANFMDDEDKALVLARLNSDYKRAETEEERERIMNSVRYLPAIYEILQQMGLALPVQLKALLAASLAPNYKGTQNELEQLKEGLGLNPPSDEFWRPLGQTTIKTQAEDKVLLLAECVPIFAGDDWEIEAAKEMVQVLPTVIEGVKEKCPEYSDADAQLLAVDLLVSDFLHLQADERAEFMPWFQGLNKEDLDGYLQMRKTYKQWKLQALI